MQINIQLLSATKTSAIGKTGKPYTMVEVAYKQDGSVKGKKLMEFKAKEICKTLLGAPAMTNFVVVQEKEGDYWEWKTISGAGTASASTEVTTNAPSFPPKTATTKGDWETRDERNARQVMIVKQSSLANAVATLKLDKAVADPAHVLALAQQYTDWVLDKGDPPKADSAGYPSQQDIESDVEF